MVAEEVDMTIIHREKLVKIVASDTSLDRCEDREEPFEIKGKKWNF